MYSVAMTVPCLPGIRALGRQTHQKALAAVILLAGVWNKRQRIDLDVPQCQGKEVHGLMATFKTFHP
jgi:hypothetical protein